jgi:hypothetical protein
VFNHEKDAAIYKEIELKQQLSNKSDEKSFLLDEN